MITIQNLKEQMKGYTLEITDLNILTGDIFGIYIDDLECKERLINLISLLEIPSKGKIKIGGIDTNDKRYQTYLRRKIGVITKNLLLIDNYNVELNIVLPIDLSAQTKNNERLIAIAKDFNLENSLKAYPKELDWVKQVSVLFARCIYNMYELIIADIDMLNEEQLLTLLNLCKTHKYTLIFFTMHVEFL